MIEKMRKYSFVLYHLDYEQFLKDLQRLGVVHVIRSKDTKSDTQIQNLELISEYAECTKYMTKLGSTSAKQANSLPPKALYNKIMQAREEKEALLRHSDVLKKQIRDLEPWGHFDYNLIDNLQAHGLHLDFHTCLKNHFKPEWKDQYAISVINERSGVLYFVLISDKGSPAIEADTFSFHKHTLQEYEADLNATGERIKDIEQYLNDIAPTAIDIFTQEMNALIDTNEFEDATQQGADEADSMVKVLSGWIPVSLESALQEYLRTRVIIHFAADSSDDDNPPIKMKNNWFVRLFEPISKLYMLPTYNDLDLTPFFAPFFMLFFGFCNADMVYGVAIIALAWFLKRKAKNDAMKSMMTLVMIFGMAAIAMGWVMGSALGYDLKEVSSIGDKILVRNNEQIFNLALLLGAIQILFGVAIATVKQMRQSGFRAGILSIGTFILLATLSILGASQLGADISKIQPYLKYPMYFSLALIMLFNTPGKNPIFNILNGIWLLYGIVTGFFGDILSYIRLFALGVSSAILGFVVNSIGQQMLGAPVVGPVIFFFFMLFGHTLNLALGGLSGFVHPLRLTFVEFYKNAAFSGPGEAYKPFSINK